MKLNEEQCQQLMLRSQGGDQEAYRDLLNLIAPSIQRYIRGRVGFLGVTDDLFQEALLGIHKARHTYLPNRPFTPWMFSIVRYKIIDEIRRNKNLRTFEFKELDALDELPVQESEATDFLGVAQLKSAIALLKEDYRMPLVLMKIEGLSVAETAARLKLSESNVKIRVFRAMKELKKQIEKTLVTYEAD